MNEKFEITPPNEKMILNVENEPESLVYKYSNYDYSYLKTPKQAKEIVWPKSYICQKTKKGIYRRNIFYDVELDQFERKILDEYKAFLHQKNYNAVDNWNEMDLFKTILDKQWNFEQAFELLQKQVNWLNDPEIHKLSEHAAQILNEGFIYIYGRDDHYRPILYLDFSSFNNKKHPNHAYMNVVFYVMGIVKEQMFINHFVESAVIILDLSTGISNLDISVIQQLIGDLNLYCAYTLHKFVFCNVGWMLRMFWKGIAIFVPDEVTEKIKFVSNNKTELLQIGIPKDQLFIEFGGIQEKPKIDKRWPPIMPHSNVIANYNEYFQEENQEEEEEFQLNIMDSNQQLLKQVKEIEIDENQDFKEQNPFSSNGKQDIQQEPIDTEASQDVPSCSCMCRIF